MIMYLMGMNFLKFKSNKISMKKALYFTSAIIPPFPMAVIIIHLLVGGCRHFIMPDRNDVLLGDICLKAGLSLMFERLHTKLSGSNSPNKLMYFHIVDQDVLPMLK